MESQQSMTIDLIKQLEEEARKLQQSTLPPVLPNEEQTEDIDYEEVKDEEVEVYNSNGKVVKIPKYDLEEYVICEDGTFVQDGDQIYIEGYIFNPYTTKFIQDNYSYDYVEHLSGTYTKLLVIEEDGSFSFDNFEIVSYLYVENEHVEFVNNEYWIKSEDFIKHNYEVKNNTLVKKKNAEDFKKELTDTYPFFVEIIDGIYRDHWDIGYHTRFQKFCLIIKFDEFIITNSKRQTHTIKDLYFLVPFDISGKKIIVNGTLYGGRGTVSNIEYTSGSYCHSHLNGNWDDITHFCLGTGPINNYILEFNRNPNEHSLFSFLYNIKIYVEWESIEGTPYKYIERLGKGEIENNEIRNPYYGIPTTFNNYIKEFKIPLKMFVQNGTTQLKIDESIIENQLIKYEPKGSMGIVYKNRTTGKYYREDIVKSIEKKSDRILLKFKGEDIYTKVYNIEKIDIKEVDYVAHPSITKQFVQYALQRIRGYYFKEVSGIDTRKSKTYSI